MDSDGRFAARVLKCNDDFRHARKLVAACKAVDAFLISAARRGKTEAMVGVPVAEIPQSPVRGERFAELPEIIDIEAEVRVVALRVRSGLCRKQNRRDVVPAPEEVAARFYRPRGRLRGYRAQLGFPGHQHAARGLRWIPAIQKSR